MRAHPFLFLFILFAFTTAASCPDECEFALEQQSVDVSVSPASGGPIAVGDTIWISAQLPELSTGLITTVVTRADTAGMLTAATETSATPVLHTGREASTPLGTTRAARTWQLECSEASCRIRVGYVMQQRGDYVISVPPLQTQRDAPTVGCTGNQRPRPVVGTGSWQQPAVPSLPQSLTIDGTFIYVDTLSFEGASYFARVQ